MKELNLTLSKATAFDICKNVLTACDVNIDEESRDKNYLRGSTDLSFLSFGNNIEITLSGSGKITSIAIQSKSTTSVQLIDWGKNDELEENIASTILRLTNL